MMKIEDLLINNYKLNWTRNDFDLFYIQIGSTWIIDFISNITLLYYTIVHIYIYFKYFCLT